MPELQGRRERFCREYIIDLHASKAYVRAGYMESAAHDHAWRMLAQPDVQQRIAELAEERNRELKLDANEIIIELLRMLTSDPLDAVDDQGKVKALHEIPIDLRRAIASFEVDTVGSTGAVLRTKVKFWSKEKAAELLGRHLTLFKDVVAVEGMEELADRIVQARERSVRSAKQTIDDVSAESLV